MRDRSTSLVLLGVGALGFSACSTTALSSAIPSTSDAPAISVTVPPLPDPDDAPPVTEPPVTEPPVTEPPVTEPPVTEPPVTEPPVTSTTLPPAITVDELVPPLEPVGTGSGAETERLQHRLLELGFWVQTVDGNYGLTTRQAVMAFQKYLGLTADGVVGPETAGYLSALTERPKGRSDAGTLLEVDKTKQLLFFVIDGKTEWILNTSTGTEIPYEKPNKNDPEIIERGTSITPAGLHQVNRERAEGWWEGDLGEIYRPKYFIGGVAVHGSNSIPNYPASHGCVRVSVPAMDWIWEHELLPMNSPVWVHGEIPAG